MTLSLWGGWRWYSVGNRTPMVNDPAWIEYVPERRTCPNYNTVNRMLCSCPECYF